MLINFCRRALQTQDCGFCLLFISIIRNCVQICSVKLLQHPFVSLHSTRLLYQYCVNTPLFLLTLKTSRVSGVIESNFINESHSCKSYRSIRYCSASCFLYLWKISSCVFLICERFNARVIEEWHVAVRLHVPLYFGLLPKAAGLFSHTLIGSTTENCNALEISEELIGVFTLDSGAE